MNSEARRATQPLDHLGSVAGICLEFGTERIGHQRPDTPSFGYNRIWYNRQRSRSTLGYFRPGDFEHFTH